MIVSEEFLKKLRSLFDLNIYEVKVWTALLSRGVAPAGELSDISNVPRSRSYDVLESLEKKGFVIMKLGKPIKYIAVKPEEILQRMQSKVRDDTENHLSMLENIKEQSVYHELELLFKQGIEKIDLTDMSGALKGRKNINDQLRGMIENAEKTITIVTTAKGFARKAEQLKSSLKKAASKGVKVRIAAPITDLGKAASELKGIAEVRKMDKPSSRFVLIDGQHLLFMMNDDSEVHEAYDTGIWVRAPFFASAMEKMFEASWQSLNKA